MGVTDVAVSQTSVLTPYSTVRSSATSGRRVASVPTRASSARSAGRSPGGSSRSAHSEATCEPSAKQKRTVCVAATQPLGGSGGGSLGGMPIPASLIAGRVPRVQSGSKSASSVFLRARARRRSTKNSSSSSDGGNNAPCRTAPSLNVADGCAANAGGGGAGIAHARARSRATGRPLGKFGNACLQRPHTLTARQQSATFTQAHTATHTHTHTA